MPRVDTYGTQQPIALLKLVIDKGFLYDRGKDLTIKYIKVRFLFQPAHLQRHSPIASAHR